MWWEGGVGEQPLRQDTIGIAVLVDLLRNHKKLRINKYVLCNE